MARNSTSLQLKVACFALVLAAVVGCTPEEQAECHAWYPEVHEKNHLTAWKEDPRGLGGRLVAAAAATRTSPAKPTRVTPLVNAYAVELEAIGKLLQRAGTDEERARLRAEAAAVPAPTSSAAAALDAAVRKSVEDSLGGAAGAAKLSNETHREIDEAKKRAQPLWDDIWDACDNFRSLDIP